MGFKRFLILFLLSGAFTLSGISSAGLSSNAYQLLLNNQNWCQEVSADSSSDDTNSDDTDKKAGEDEDEEPDCE